MVAIRPRAAVITIGDEVLGGEVREENLTYLIDELNKKGLEVVRGALIRDKVDEIANELRAILPYVEHCFVTGGIGTTHDDQTRQAVAQTYQVPLTQHPKAAARLKAHFGPRVTPERMKLADLPTGCRLLENPLSPAAGFQIGKVWVLPGIPAMVKAMVPLILPHLPGLPVQKVDLWIPRPETEIAAVLREAAGRFPHIHIGSYPQFGEQAQGVVVRLKGEDQNLVREAESWLRDKVGQKPLK